VRNQALTLGRNVITTAAMRAMTSSNASMGNGARRA
jgi:hypothetical protein